MKKQLKRTIILDKCQISIKGEHTKVNIIIKVYIHPKNIERPATKVIIEITKIKILFFFNKVNPNLLKN